MLNLRAVIVNESFVVSLSSPVAKAAAIFEMDIADTKWGRPCASVPHPVCSRQRLLKSQN